MFIVWIAVAVPIFVAASVLIGWGADIELLRRFGTASVTMNPGSAIAFLVLAGGLALRAAGPRIPRVLPTLLIAMGGLIGVLKLLDIGTGTRLSIDSMLFASKLSLAYAQPSRIAPNMALCFLLVSTALLLMTNRAERLVIASQLAAICAGLIAVFALVGHLYGVNAFYVVGPLHPVAVPSAVNILCLVTFAVVRTSRRGLVAPLSDSGPAGRSSRALLPAAFAIPVACGWLRQQGEHAGLFSGEIGVALMVMLTMLAMTVLIWQNARWLLASDRLRLKAEADMAYMARHDFLTGLPNRGYFMDKLIARMARRPRPGAWFAVITMDLDGFKQVNDRLGHAAGDALLCQVGSHLQDCRLRHNDLVARIGGDEFAMLLDGIASTDAAAGVAARIVADMPSLFGPAGREVPVGISVGIAVADHRHLTPEALLADADKAVYAAKRSGRGRFVLHPAADRDKLALFTTGPVNLCA